MIILEKLNEMVNLSMIASQKIEIGEYHAQGA